MRVVRREAFEHVADARVTLHGLPEPFRYLILLGYLSTFTLLLAVVLTDVVGQAAQLGYTSGGELVHVPVATVIFATTGLALGWAFLISGATDAGRPLALSFLALLAFQSGMLDPGSAIVGLVVVAAAGALYARSHGHPTAWRHRPVMEFVGWLVLCAGLSVYPWLLGNAQEVAENVDLVTAFLAVLMLPMWVAFGLDTVDFAARTARFVAANVADRVSDHALRPGVAILASGVVLGSFVGAATFRDSGSQSVAYGWLSLTFLASLLVLAFSAVAMVFRRWTKEAATIGVAGLVLATLVPLAFSVAVRSGQGLDEAALGAAGVVPPGVVFAVLLAYNVLTFVPRVTDTDGRRVGRPGRVLLYFGYVLIVVAASGFQLAVVGRSDEGFRFKDFVDDCYGIGLLVLGIPYLLWLLVRRRDRLIGPQR